MKKWMKITIIALLAIGLLVGGYYILDADYVKTLSRIDGYNGESNAEVANMFVFNDSTPAPQVYETGKLETQEYSLEGYTFKPIQMAATDAGYYVACTTNLPSMGPGYSVYYLEVDGGLLENDGFAFYTHGLFGNVVELVFIEEGPSYDNITMIIKINENTVEIPIM